MNHENSQSDAKVHELQEGVCRNCGATAADIGKGGWICRPSGHKHQLETAPRSTFPLLLGVLTSIFVVGLLIFVVVQADRPTEQTVASAEGALIFKELTTNDRVTQDVMNDPSVGVATNQIYRNQSSAPQLQANLAGVYLKSAQERAWKRYIASGEIARVRRYTRVSLQKGYSDSLGQAMAKVTVLTGPSAGFTGYAYAGPGVFADSRPDDDSRRASEENKQVEALLSWMNPSDEQQRQAAADSRRADETLAKMGLARQAGHPQQEEHERLEHEKMSAEFSLQTQAEERRLAVEADVRRAVDLFWSSAGLRDGRSVEEIAAVYPTKYPAEVMTALREAKVKWDAQNAEYHARPEVAVWDAEKREQMAATKEQRMRKEAEYQAYRREHPEQKLPEYSYVQPAEFKAWKLGNPTASPAEKTPVRRALAVNEQGNRLPEASKAFPGEEEYQRGEALRKGTSPDLAGAIAAYQRAAELGHPKAMYRLGGMYAKGEGVLKNEVLTNRYYRLAADAGLAEAQYDLGVRCVLGRGIRKDEDTGLGWYKKAAAQGYQQAIDELKKRGISP